MTAPDAQDHHTLPDSAPTRPLLSRCIGAFRLDWTVFEEVEHDARSVALSQAALVVAAGGIARGIGVAPQDGWIGLLAGVIGGFLIWLLTTAVVGFVGIRHFHYTSSYPELMRVLGFAAAPLVLLALCALPVGAGAAAGISLAAHALAVAALVIATRQALDIDTPRALGVCLLAVLVSAVGVFLLGILLFAGRVS